jgi:AhpD family alkylhydroperoxidase
MGKVEEFAKYREAMNEVILGKKNKVINRLYNLDTNTYEAGALDRTTKELIGLVASLVLRCDDCVKYHLQECHALGLGTEALYEALSIGSIVGGTITIPHLRRAAEFWEALQEDRQV